MARLASLAAAIMILNSTTPLSLPGSRSWTSFLPGTRREPPTSWAAGAGAMVGPGGVTSPGSWEQGKPRRPSYYIQCREERSGRALAALIPRRQPRRSSELRMRVLLWGSEEAGTGAASLLPRTTKKNAEVGAPGAL